MAKDSPNAPGLRTGNSHDHATCGGHHDHHSAHGGTPAGKAADQAHDHAPGHSHTHGHGHSHAPKDFGNAFLIGIALNTVFVLAEGVAGILANSTALLADAGHNLSDVLGLIVAWAGATLARRPANARFPSGFARSSILAALINAILLLLAVGAIGYAVVERIASPRPMEGLTVIVVAALGIVINGITAWLFASGGSDINVRGAYLHMLADAAVSAGVVITGILYMATGSLWIDPAVSMVILVIILVGTWGLLRESLRLSLDAVPAWIDADAIRRFLESRPGVARLDRLRIRPLSTTEAALTVRLIMPEGSPGDTFLRETEAQLAELHDIREATLQIERGDANAG